MAKKKARLWGIKPDNKLGSWQRGLFLFKNQTTADEVRALGMVPVREVLPRPRKRTRKGER